MSGGSVGVAVYGMGRSGTSAVTGLFAAAGYYVGQSDKLLAPDQGNPLGYHEHQRVLMINEKILQALGASWFVPPTDDQMDGAQDWAVLEIESVFSALICEANGAPLALKDPRIQVLLPLWEPIIGGRLHPVLVIRHPIEIARSLQRRNGTPIPFALASWEIHMTTLLGRLRQRTVTVAPYVEVLESDLTARDVIIAASRHLPPELALRVLNGGWHSSLRPCLYRNRFRERSGEDQLTRRQQELWRWLATLAPGDCQLDPPESLTFPGSGAVAVAREETRRTAGITAVWEKEQEVHELNTALHQARTELYEARTDLHGLRLELHDVNTELHNTRIDMHACAITRDELTLAVLDQTDRADAALAAEANALRQYALMVTSRAWRVTWPARVAAEAVRRGLRVLRAGRS